jgi:exopolysaccharide production protein ExoY
MVYAYRSRLVLHDVRFIPELANPDSSCRCLVSETPSQITSQIKDMDGPAKPSHDPIDGSRPATIGISRSEVASKVVAESEVAVPVGGRRKRVFDFTVALLALLAVSPLFVLVVLMVKWSSPGPVFFSQKRVGYRGRRFRCYKFRTMFVDADAQLRRLLEQSETSCAEWAVGEKLRRDPRVTKIGQVLRLSSIDELPQLVNVLRGEMSLVGPRPIVDGEIPRYREKFYDYLRARPGITGLWQVSGRNDLSYDMRTELDQKYVRNWSMIRDFAIIMRTIAVVLSSKGCY